MTLKYTHIVSGQMFIVMAYYAGETLQEKIKRGPLPVEEAINIATPVAQGLERAHEGTRLRN